MKADYDLIIVGAGAAGLAAALFTHPMKVLMVTLEKSAARGSTTYAQGGVAGALSPEDSVEAHLVDTLKAGGELVDSQVAKELVSQGREVLEDLIDLGMPFDRGSKGLLQFGREGAHSHNRILHSGGDATGRGLSAFMWKKIHENKSTEILQGSTLVDLRKQDSLWRGRFLQAQGRIIELSAENFILATGSPGALFGRTTNPMTALGDGLLLALRLGLPLENLEMVQYHPTALDIPGHQGSIPLISEAVRGKGAELVFKNGAPIPIDHPQGSLGPRDQVARAIWRQRLLGKTVYLNTPKTIGKAFSEFFPTISQICSLHGLDPSLDFLPVTPAVHYHMGGVPSGLDGSTDLPGLFVLGELASTGVHGSNRLASNSLLECLVMGRLCAEQLRGHRPSEDQAPHQDPVKIHTQDTEISPLNKESIKTAQQLFDRAMGPLRNGKDLKTALEYFKEITPNLPHLPIEPRAFGPRERLFLRSLFMTAALEREESRGAHYREDFPQKNPKFASSSQVYLEQGTPKVRFLETSQVGE